jgi:RNA-directed DNA polymerase
MPATQPPIQLELDLAMPERGEAACLEGQEAEAGMATEDEASPARTRRLMEAICDPENIAAAMRAVIANKGAPGVDGMTVRQLPKALALGWPALAQELLNGRYRPQPVRRVEIPKPDGGTRKLGIPTAIDRVIQQALLQRLQPEWDATFSEHAYGFRPGRSAHQAVAQAQAHVAAGRQWVVDIDLAKFFDRVNHDRLMAQVSRRIADRRVVKLIRAYLEAGVLDNGVIEASEEGTPQGGPLSPLLSNLVLDELDRELERRGLAFVRYADDCNVYVGSAKAGHRVMASLTRFIERRLRLKVNAAKSAVDRPWNRSFLGFTLSSDEGHPRAVSDKALSRFKQRLRAITGRHRGIDLKRMIAELNPFLRGWAGYYGFSEGHELASLDGWIRRRLRCLLWVQWKTRRKRFVELKARGLDDRTAFASIMSSKGPWRLSLSHALHRTLTNRFFETQALVSMAKQAIVHA